jgi:hypothetical protein
MEIPPEKKYALLVGINYQDTDSELRGCENDVKHMKEYLITSRGYLDKNIIELTENTPKKPTAVNIMHALGTLVVKAHVENVEEIFLHYSGHGSYTRDRDSDEDDKRDETIVPLDYKTAGMITDDQLHDYVSRIPKTCRLFALFDCCHSGTILDLRWRYEGDTKNYMENKSSDINSNIVMISGCRDDQTSADAWIKGKWSGAMTCSFLDKINSCTTWESLLCDMRKYLKENQYTQFPRLSCSRKLTDQDVIFK